MTPSLVSERKLYCSFCTKAAEEVEKLIAGPTALICNECVALVQEMIAESGGASIRKEPSSLTQKGRLSLEQQLRFDLLKLLLERGLGTLTKSGELAAMYERQILDGFDKAVAPTTDQAG